MVCEAYSNHSGSNMKVVDEMRVEIGRLIQLVVMGIERNVLIYKMLKDRRGKTDEKDGDR